MTAVGTSDSQTHKDDVHTVARGASGLFFTLAVFAWRNLWRNPRRTWLTIGGVAFAVWFLVFARSVQTGTFDLMIDNTARVMTGHMQVLKTDYLDEPRVEDTILIGDMLERLTSHPEVAHASARAQGFALVSSGEQSFGGQIIGVDAEVEKHWSALADAVVQGRYLQQPGEAVLGSVLARNLGLQVGDEFVLLGTARGGGVAAHAARLVGIFTMPSAHLNRGLVQIPLQDFRDAWALAPSEAHMLVVIADSVAASEHVVRSARMFAGSYQIADWQTLMPETVQMRDMKVVGTDVFFLVIAIIVGFSVLNTFMMTIYERTPEFGVLMATGMRPHQLQLQLHMEALYLSALGVGIGAAVATGIIAMVGSTGIPIPVDQADELLAQYNMSDRLYPSFDTFALMFGTVLMLAGVQLAAFIPGLRLYRLRPVDALRLAS